MFADAFAGRASVAAMSAASAVIVAHGAGLATYGAYATATGFAQLLATWTDLGSAQVVVREVTVSRDRSTTIRTYLWIRCALVLVACLVGAAVVPLAFSSDYRSAALLALATTLFCGPSVVFPLAQLEGNLSAVRNAFALQGVVALALTVWMVLAIPNPSPGVLVMAPVAGSVVASGAALRWLRRSPYRMFGAVTRTELTTMARGIGGVGAGTILTSIYGKLDAVLVLRFVGPVEAGIYAAGYRLLDQVRMLTFALTTPLVPGISAGLARGAVDAPATLMLQRLGVRVGLGITAGMAGTAPLLAWIFMGEATERGALIITVLSAVAGGMVLSQMWVLVLIHARRVSAWATLAGGSVLFNVGLNLWLIPQKGALGAALATVLTEGAFLIGAATVARSCLRGPVVAVSCAAAVTAVVLASGLIAAYGIALEAFIVSAAGLVVAGGLAVSRGLLSLRSPRFGSLMSGTETT